MSHARFRESRESRRIVGESSAASLFNPPEPPDSSSPANSSRARASRGPSAAETGAAADARLAEERARAEISARGFVSRFGRRGDGEVRQSNRLRGRKTTTRKRARLDPARARRRVRDSGFVASGRHQFAGRRRSGGGADAPVCRLGSATGVPLAIRAETLGLACACACLPPRSATNARLDAALHASRPLFCRDGALASSPSRVRRPARSRRTALVAVTGIHRGRRLRRDAPGVRSRVTLRPNLSAARPAVPPGRLLVTWTREELRFQRRDGRRIEDSEICARSRPTGTKNVKKQKASSSSIVVIARALNDTLTSLTSPFTTPSSSSSSSSRPSRRHARRTAPPRRGTRARPSRVRARHPVRARRESPRTRPPAEARR